MSISRQAVKHIPQRTCVACRTVKDRRELVRLVCTSTGGVELDVKGNKVGRGAYLCPVQECWESGLKGGRLEHSLKTALTRDNREQLIRLGKDLLEEQFGGRGK